MSDRESQPLSDADVLAWAVVLTHRERQKRDGNNILLLPYPPCPTCGEPVYDAEQVTFDRPARLASDIRLTMQPCGHVHTTSDEHVRRVWVHIHEMTSDVASGYHGHATEARTWTTDEIVREARARVAGTATESDKYPASADSEQPADQPSVEDAVRLEGALHVLRYALDRFTRIGYNPAPEYLRDLVDKITDNPGDPCDRDQQYARAEASEAEVRRLRAGEGSGWDPLAVPTPGQWIARWNEAPAEERLDVARQVIEDHSRAARCFVADHETRIVVADKMLAARLRVMNRSEAALARVRAESARIRSITPTWGPVADLIDAALDDPGRPKEQRARPTHPDGTPYSYSEITAEGWGFCDGCRMWSTATPERPHQCAETHMKGPISSEGVGNA